MKRYKTFIAKLKDTINFRYKEKQEVKINGGKYYKLKDIINQLTPKKLERLKKYKLDASMVDDWYYYNDINYSAGLKLGKVADDKAVLIPVAEPYKWHRENIKDVQVFISDEEYQQKILPLILSAE